MTRWSNGKDGFAAPGGSLLAPRSSFAAPSAGFDLNPAPAPAHAWSQLTTTGAPPSIRGFHAACYVPTRSSMFVLGGSTDATNAIDSTLYELSDAGAWSTPTVSGTAPAKRFSHTMVYDDTNDCVYVIGGYDAGYLNPVGSAQVFKLVVATMTWSSIGAPNRPAYGSFLSSGAYLGGAANKIVWWPGNPQTTGAPTDTAFGNSPPTTSGGAATTWSAFASTKPAARNSAIVIADITRQKFALIGGNNLDTKTHESNGTATNGWTDVTGSITGHYTAREGGCGAWCATFGAMIFGGDDGTNRLTATEFYDGSAWTAPAQSVEPSARGRASLVWSSGASRFVLFGGDAAAGYKNDVWVYS